LECADLSALLVWSIFAEVNANLEGDGKAMRFKRAIFTVLFISLIPIVWSTDALTVRAQDNKPTKGAAIFKIPDGYMRAPMNDFRGMFVLDPKKPAGMFVTYPNDNETTAALRQRVLKTIGPMFIHEGKGNNETTIAWDTTALPAHAEDGDGKAEANVYSGPTTEVQIVIYERTTGPVPFLYGYFAMRHKSPKGDDGKFLDPEGKGVKPFDKLWQSFPK
jgi:hypothetical protein